MGIHRLPSPKVPESTQRGLGTWQQFSTVGWNIPPSQQQLSHKAAVGWGPYRRPEQETRDALSKHIWETPGTQERPGRAQEAEVIRQRKFPHVAFPGKSREVLCVLPCKSQIGKLPACFMRSPLRVAWPCWVCPTGHGQEHSPLWTPRRVCSSRQNHCQQNTMQCWGNQKDVLILRHQPHTEQGTPVLSMSIPESHSGPEAQKERSSHLAELQQLLLMFSLGPHSHSEPSSLHVWPPMDAIRSPVPQSQANEHFAISGEMLT